MNAARLWLLTVAVFLGAVAQASGAPRSDDFPRDATAADASNPPPAAVEIVVVGTARDLLSVRALFGARGVAGATPTWVLVSRFDPLDIVREPRPPERRGVRCWVDMSNPRLTRLFFAAGSGDRFLVRDIAVLPQLDEEQHALGEVLERAVTALLDDERAGLDRAQVQALLESRRHETRGRAKAVSPAPTPGLPPSTFGMSVAGFYAGQALRLESPRGNSVALVHGPGLSVAIGVKDRRRRWAIWGAAQLQFPNSELANDVGFEFQTTATRGGLELQQTIGDDVGERVRISKLILRVGSGLDLVRLTPRPGAGGSPTRLDHPRWSTSLVFTAATGAGLWVGRSVSLALTAFADVLPTTVHYDLEVQGQDTRVFSAARVRPGVALELAWGQTL